MKLLALVVFEILQKRSFCDGEVGDGINLIYSWLEVSDDVIYSEDVETFQEYVCKIVGYYLAYFLRKSKSAFNA